MSPGRLSGILDRLPRVLSPELIVGMESMDDAGVYRIAPDLALVQTVDFFSPVVAGPVEFGRIAAANSMSDVWAMGGDAITAMNLLCFPGNTLGSDIIEQILSGACEKLVEAGVVLVGGHTMEQDQIVFGLSVTGVIHPEKALRNSGARPGDVLVLTKPLGSGVMTTANKASALPPELFQPVLASMERLNLYASRILRDFNVSAMTDVTGFGLLGHALAMAKSASVSFRIESSCVPLFTGARSYAKDFFPGGSGNNRKYVGENVSVADGLEAELVKLLFDAQTSGGLLAAVLPEQADEMLDRLHQNGDTASAVIGEVCALFERPLPRGHAVGFQKPSSFLLSLVSALWRFSSSLRSRDASVGLEGILATGFLDA